MSAKILVCVTCDRYSNTTPAKPTPGERLATAMREQVRRNAVPTAIRSVECLSNCPNPCAAALRAPGKASIRLCKLTVDDASALLIAAHAYAESRDGDLPLEAFPTSLRSRCLTVLPTAAGGNVETEGRPNSVTIVRRTLKEHVREKLAESTLKVAISPDSDWSNYKSPRKWERAKPVRDALCELESLGLIETENHRVTRVRRLDEDELKDMYETRAAFEERGTRLATLHLDQTGIAELGQIVYEILEAAAASLKPREADGCCARGTRSRSKCEHWPAWPERALICWRSRIHIG